MNPYILSANGRAILVVSSKPEAEEKQKTLKQAFGKVTFKEWEDPKAPKRSTRRAPQTEAVSA